MGIGLRNRPAMIATVRSDSSGGKSGGLWDGEQVLEGDLTETMTSQLRLEVEKMGHMTC